MAKLPAPKFIAVLVATVLTVLVAAHAQAAELSADGRRIRVSKDGVAILVEAYSEEMLHFEISAESQNVEKPIYTTPMVVMLPRPLASITRTANTLETERLKATVDIDTLCVTVIDKKEDRTLAQNCPLNPKESWKGLTMDLQGANDVYGLGNYFRTFNSADGTWKGGVWDPGDGMGNTLRGFGKGATSYAMFPIIYALGQGKQGVAIFLDQIYKQQWSFNTSTWRVDMWGDQMRWFVIAGSSLGELRKSYMQLTGLAPLPPKKTLGLWVSEFGYGNWTEAYKPVLSMRANGFPLDGLGMDIQWFGGAFFDRGADTRASRFGTLQFDPVNFPNALNEIKSLRDDRGVSLMTIEESYVSAFLPEHKALADAQLLAHSCAENKPVYLDSNPWWGVGGMIDWTNPAAGDYWHDLKRQKLYSLGITSHWADLGEPEMFDPSACYYGFPELGKTHHGDIHNIYNFKWLESIARGYERNKNRLRPYMMARSGTSGVQRFGAGMWSGDIAANMGSMAAHYNVQMHMSLSGIDYFSSDIGGFHRRPETLDGDADELYTQWFANATLFDFPVRPHVWNLGKKLHTAPDAIGDMASNRFNIQQRYALSPYYYSLAYRASKDGTPVIPPMVYVFQDDMNVRSMGNQKMIGPFLMGALVASYGEIERTVYLPKGTWYNFHTHLRSDSTGHSIPKVPAVQNGIFRPPLFARAGALIPMMYVDRLTMNILGRREGQPANADLYLRVYPSAAPTSFELYEDDGESTDYKSGQYALTRLEQQRLPDFESITIRAIQGAGFKSLPLRRNQILEVIASGAKRVAVNNVSLKECPVSAAMEFIDQCWRQEESLVRIKTGAMPVSIDKTITIGF